MSMDKLLVVLLAGAPFWAFLLWAAWCLVSHVPRDRREAREATRMSRR